MHFIVKIIYRYYTIITEFNTKIVLKLKDVVIYYLIWNDCNSTEKDYL